MCKATSLAIPLALQILFGFSILGQSLLHAQNLQESFYVKIHGGLSSYIGDNNTVAFNRDVFGVEGKWPYSYGLEMGYQQSARWRLGLSAVFADYPIITRFNDRIQVDSHPTKRTSFQAISNYVLSSGRLQPYFVMGMHLTFGDVSIFEERKLLANARPEVHKHFMWGPVLGLGIGYNVTPVLMVLTQLSTKITLLDDSADGRLPLGPPLPTNLRVKDRFAPFDLLSGLSVGLIARPGCASDCEKWQQSEGFSRSKKGQLRVSRVLTGGLTALSYHFTPGKMKRLFLGIETGLGPKAIKARFVHPDGLVEHDEIYFNDAFAGVSLRYFGAASPGNKVTVQAGILAAIPRQIQLTAGFDYHLATSFSLGLEGRYALCPSRAGLL